MSDFIHPIKRLADPRYKATWVLILSGALGFRVGIVAFPTWQVAVETAQVVARLVEYPAGNPVYLYHTKLFTVLHQICAVLLRLGLSEITLSLLLSGVLGMVAFQALALTVCALSRNVLLAIGATFVVFFSRVTDHGVTYPILLMGTEHTYGSLGLSLFVLVAALLGSGCYRLGAFLLGVAPAVHPSLGAWLWLAVALVFAWDFKKLREDLRPALKYFVAGGALAALSLLVHLTVTYDVPEVAPEIASRYLSAFTRLWDEHRQPVSLQSGGVSLNIGALALALTWLFAFPDHLPRSAVFLLRFVAVCAALSLAFVFVSWIPPEKLPSTLVILMPARLLNVNVMVCIPLLVGLIGIYRDRFWSQLLTAVLLGAVLLGSRSMVWEWVREKGWPLLPQRLRPDLLLFFTLVSLALLCLAVSTRNDRRRQAPWLATTAARMTWLGIVVLAGVLTWRLPTGRPPRFLDRTNDAFFATVAAERNGLMLTSGSDHLLQLYTRRPVLLDGGGLDALPYTLEAGPETARILRDVYEIDLFNPPPEVARRAVIPHDFNKRAWERYSRRRWQEIGRQYNVTQVLTRVDYTLDLPIEAQSRELRLYRIPD